jgi:hypothetical protein
LPLKLLTELSSRANRILSAITTTIELSDVASPELFIAITPRTLFGERCSSGAGLVLIRQRQTGMSKKKFESKSQLE